MRHYLSHLSLIQGWLPPAVQVITAAVLMCAIGWRSPHWRTVWLPVTLAGGVVLVLWAHRYIGSLGVAGDPAPTLLWIWIASTGLATGVLVLGWPGARWWRRGLAVLAVPLCVLSARSRSTGGWATSRPCTPPGTSSPAVRCPTRLTGSP